MHPKSSCLHIHQILCLSLCFIFILYSSAVFSATEIKPFTTDGCSAFPNGTVEQHSLWVNCCIRHDLAYWKGGSYEERLTADKALQSCVAQVGEPEVAKLMLAGVRIGGSPYYPTGFRWGYGWSYPRGYALVSEEEKKEIQLKLKMLELMIQSLSVELNKK